jgi:hypothetical protein
MDIVTRSAGTFAVAIVITGLVTIGSAMASPRIATDAPVETPAEDKTAMPTVNDLADSASRLAELRKHLRPYWFPGEAGGIVLLMGLDEEDSERFFTALTARVPELAQVAPDKQLAKLIRILTEDIRAFLAAGKLEPGAYRLDNYHLDYAVNGEVIFNADGDPPIVLPADRTFTFTVSDEHVKLLRCVYTRELHGSIELMDMKRPYGDMTYYFLDMADALGEPIPRNANGEYAFTPQQIERYLQLHREMLFASQAFWVYAR